jgi:hypothetical protein
MEIECVYTFAELSNILDIESYDNNEEDEDVGFMDSTPDDQVQSNMFDENSAGLGSRDELETFGNEEDAANGDEGSSNTSDIEDYDDISDNANGEVCIFLSNDEDESESSEGSESETEDDIGQSDTELSWSKTEILREMRRLKALSGISICKVI